MEGLIFLMNRLQDTMKMVGSDIQIKLPRIAVVGGQSAGKSSVLENVVGKSFLPSGAGIVTRRPLVLQLIHDPNEEYGKFDHNEKRFPNLVGVREEIENETKRICSKNDVSELPIHLTIHSPNVINLTLVDLPGLVKIATGDQDKSIVPKIQKMVESYVKDENCLMLAVTQSSQDATTSEALEMCLRVDPEGDRTIGVFTKLDTNLNSYNSLISTLSNRDVKLKLGYYGIINRRPHELKEHIDRSALKARDEQYFNNHPEYKAVAHRCGLIKFQNELQNNLIEHIRRSLPGLTMDIEEKLREVESLLGACDVDWDAPNARVMALTKVVKAFSESIEADLGFAKDLGVIKKDTTTTGTKIKDVLFVQFPKRLDSAMNNQRLSLQTIVAGIHRSSGVFNEEAFHTPTFNEIVRTVLHASRPIVIDIVLQVKNLLIDLVKTEGKEVITYENLRREVIKLTITNIDELHQSLLKHVKAILDANEEYIDGLNSDYLLQVAKHRVMSSSNRENAIIQEVAKGKEDEDCFISGELILSKKAIMGANKKAYYAELKKDRLNLFTNRGSKAPKTVYLLNDITYKASVENLTFTLLSPKAGTHDFIVSSQELLGEWANALQNAGVLEADVAQAYLANEHADSDESGNKLRAEEETCPPGTSIHLWNCAKQIRISVMIYVNIIKKDYMNLLTKLIASGMPLKLKEKIGPYLSASLMNDLDEKGLMDQNEEDILRIRKLKAQREALRSALDVIKDPKSIIAQSKSVAENESQNRRNLTPQMNGRDERNLSSHFEFSSTSDLQAVPPVSPISRKSTGSQFELNFPGTDSSQMRPNDSSSNNAMPGRQSGSGNFPPRPSLAANRPLPGNMNRNLPPKPPSSFPARPPQQQ